MEPCKIIIEHYTIEEGRAFCSGTLKPCLLLGKQFVGEELLRKMEQQAAGNMGITLSGTREETITQERAKLQEPPLYKVLLHNDDYTTMDFVVMILEVIFGKNTAEATAIMLSVHNQGQGVAGIYPREIGETKVAEVHQLARKNQYPLKCSLERA